MSYLFKTEHYEMVLKAGDMERVLPSWPGIWRSPGSARAIPTFTSPQLACKFVKVVLSGAGGDELFAGYPWRYYRAVVNDDFEHYIDKYYLFWQRLIPNHKIPQVSGPSGIRSSTSGPGISSGMSLPNRTTSFAGLRTISTIPSPLRPRLSCTASWWWKTN